MNELRPLLDTSEHEDERAWLRAARAEAPSASGMRDAAVALGLTTMTANALAASLPTAAPSLPALGAGGAASSGASVATAVGTASLGALGKGLLGGAVVSFLALSTLDHTLGSASNSDRATSAVTVRSAASSGVVPPTREHIEPHSIELGAPPTKVKTTRRPASRVSSPLPAEAPPTPVDTPARADTAFAPPPAGAAGGERRSASLARETELLDRARRALGAGDLNQASQALSSYAASHPGPVLTLEARQLQVRLLLARGDRTAAVALARRTIQSHPESAHVALLQQLAATP